MNPASSSHTLTNRTLTGARWAYSGTIVNAIAQIGFSAAMARLLEPADFGVYAIALVVSRFGQFFSQMGVGRALIQKAHLSDSEIRAGFTSLLLLSIIMYAFAWLSAPLAARFFDNPQLVPIIRAITISYVFIGIGSTAASLLRRDLQFRQIAVTEVISYIAGYGGVGVALALHGSGVWSLVIASIVQSGVASLLYIAFRRHSIIPLFEWAHHRRLLSFGSRVSAVSILEFAGSTVDTIAIGRIFGDSVLGIYNRALMLVTLPVYQFATSLNKVLFPSFSIIQDQPERLRRGFLTATSLAAVIIFSISFGISAAAEELVEVLLGSQWRAAIPVVRVLALAASLNFLTYFLAVLCEATARLWRKIFIQLAFLLVLASGFILASTRGLVAFALAIVVAELVRHLLYLIAVRRVVTLTRGDLFRTYAPSLLVGFLVAAPIYFLSVWEVSHELPDITVLLSQIATGALGLWIALQAVPIYREFLSTNLKSPAQRFLLGLGKQ